MTEEQIRGYVKEVLEETTFELSEWAVDSWTEAKERGIIVGYNEDRSEERPQATPTREQVVFMLMKALNLIGSN